MTTTIQVLLLVTALVLVVVNSILRREPAKLKRHIKYLLGSLKREQNTLEALEGRAATDHATIVELKKRARRMLNCVQWLAVDGPREQCGKFYDLAQGDGYDSLLVAMAYYDDLRANRPGKPTPGVPWKDDKIADPLIDECMALYYGENSHGKAHSEKMDWSNKEMWVRLGSITQVDLLSRIPEKTKQVTDKLVTIQGSAEIC